jgi:hypothetical protein
VLDLVRAAIRISPSSAGACDQNDRRRLQPGQKASFSAYSGRQAEFEFGQA